MKKPLICDYCGRKFEWKKPLIQHILMHASQENLPRTEGLTCVKCNIVFKNKGLLSCHNSHVHNPRDTTPSPTNTEFLIPQGTTSRKNARKGKNPRKKIRQNKYKHICQVCQTNFFYLKDLKLHIREYHFNLLSQIPYFQVKKVNQVWFEKVMNSENIVEIKKVAHNMLLMRKLDDNTAMKVSDHSTEVIDLHNLYPTGRKNQVQCKFCLRSYDKNYIFKHEMEVHMKFKDKEMI